MKILICNDDGINAVGIQVLAEVFSENNEIFMVAPDTERSAFSHSLTIFNDLFLEKSNFPFAKEAYTTSGTPADCVKFALLHLFKDNPPDLVISGINNGPNLGSDIMYSGTVAGAMEAAYLGFPAIAVSINYWKKDETHYREAAHFLKRNLKKILALQKDAGTVININYPVLMPYKGAKVTKTGVNLYSDSYTAGDKLNSFRLRGMPIEHGINDEDCDVEWSKKGFATITPLMLDRTDYAVIRSLSNKVDIE